MQLALQSVDKLQNAAGFGFDDRLHHHLATAIQHGNHNRFLVHVHSDIFNVTTHLSCLLGGKVIRLNDNLSLKVKCHSSANLPILFCGSLATMQTAITLSAAAAERSPAKRSAAKAASHLASNF